MARKNYTPEMVAHLWANQSVEEAQNATRTIFFDGKSIYSYDRSFEMARHVEFNGKKAVLVSTARASDTTARHQQLVRYALTPQTTLEVEEIGASHGVTLSMYRRRLERAATDVACARKLPEEHLASYIREAKRANAYITFYELDTPLFALAITEELLVQCKAKRKEANARTLQGKKERKEREAKLALEKLTAWLEGMPHSSAPRGLGQVYMRVKGDLVQTSMGAEFPVTHAARIFKMIARCVRTGVPHQKNGHTEHVGHFEVDSISEKGDVKAGCHFILWAEVKRIADLIGAKEEA